ncbi:hypothetical protein L5515_018563 [Caenorhabditis briggsae]|uniref:Uncharacterized protein n=1 Tax=Caenorhabditis briggsae TaxID=6238 RepID=A0AAE9FG63_CAEBR|nr:hypothetical protein L5515_018563 [Caenorhabditis briggsae]
MCDSPPPSHPYLSEDYWRKKFEKHLKVECKPFFKSTVQPNSFDESFMHYISTKVCQNFVLHNCKPQVEESVSSVVEQCPEEILNDLKQLDLKTVYDKVLIEIIGWKIMIIEVESNMQEFENQGIREKWPERLSMLHKQIEDTSETIMLMDRRPYDPTKSEIDKITKHMDEVIRQSENLARIQNGGNTYEYLRRKPCLDLLDNALQCMKIRTALLGASIEVVKVHAARFPEPFRPSDFAAPIDEILEKIEAARRRWSIKYTNNQSLKYSETANYFLKLVSLQFVMMKKSEEEFRENWHNRPDYNVYEEHQKTIDAMRQVTKTAFILHETRMTLVEIFLPDQIETLKQEIKEIEDRANEE